MRFVKLEGNQISGKSDNLHATFTDELPVTAATKGRKKIRKKTFKKNNFFSFLLLQRLLKNHTSTPTSVRNSIPTTNEKPATPKLMSAISINLCQKFSCRVTAE